MNCPYCKVEITYDAEICPLCHTPLKKGEQIETAVSVYPKKSRAKKLFTPSFEKIYIYCALHVFALSILLNIRFLPQFPWSALVCVFLIAGFLITKQIFIAKSRLKLKTDYPKVGLSDFIKRFFHF